METYDNDEHLYQEEIDIRELVLVLWKKKFQIISVALVIAIITGLISFFLISPVYHVDMRMVLNMPESYNTKYGGYALPIRSNEEYLNMLTSNDVLKGTIEDMEYDDITIEDIRKRVSIDIDNQNNTQNVFLVKVSANDPEDAKKLADSLYDNYTEFINVITIEGALEYYINSYSVQQETLKVSLETKKNSLEKNEELLAETPATINQKAVLEELENQGSVNDFIVLERIVNPNYTAIESNIVEDKQSINSIENSLKIIEDNLQELNITRDLLEEYYVSNSYDDLSTNTVNLANLSISLPSKPIVPSQKTSPSNGRNVIIAGVLGGMLGVIVVLSQWWWKNGESEENSI